MRSAAEGLEPAERDEKKLRKTAFLLVAFMVVGGILITMAYNKATREQAKDWRPSFSLGEMKSQRLDLMLADGTVVNTAEIEEDLWLFMQNSLRNGEVHEEREKALALLPKEGVRVVEFFVDVDPNVPEERAKLAELPVEEGHWRVAARAEVLDKFLKNTIKFGTVPHEKEGKWIYDNGVAILKRDRPDGGNPRVQIRGEIFDFDRAAREAEEKGQRELARGYREDWFLKHVNYLLAEGDPTASK